MWISVRNWSLDFHCSCKAARNIASKLIKILKCLSTSGGQKWPRPPHGYSPEDMAMFVVLKSKNSMWKRIVCDFDVLGVVMGPVILLPRITKIWLCIFNALLSNEGKNCQLQWTWNLFVLNSSFTNLTSNSAIYFHEFGNSSVRFPEYFTKTIQLTVFNNFLNNRIWNYERLRRERYPRWMRDWFSTDVCLQKVKTTGIAGG